MYAFDRQLQGLRKTPDVDPGPVLRKFWVQCQQLRSMPQRLVPQLLYFGSQREFSHRGKGSKYREGRRQERNDNDRMGNAWSRKKKDKEAFLRARRGDHLMVQFECDDCVFRKVKKRHPIKGNHHGALTQACIRRILLDAFWSRATSTGEGHANKIDLGIKLCNELGTELPYQNSGPLPEHDHCGYGVALQMVLQSKSSGRYAEDHQQWDTTRKLGTVFSNQVRASAAANSFSLSVGDFDGKSYQRISADVCSSLWFQKFSTGCKHRMGQDWRPDRAISNKQMRHLLHTVERRIRNAKDNETCRRWIKAGCYFAICYVDSLRGPEGLLLDLEGIRDHFKTGMDKDYVVVALLGTSRENTSVANVSSQRPVPPLRASK